MTKRAAVPVPPSRAKRPAISKPSASLFAAKPMGNKVGFLIRRLHQLHLGLFIEETGGIDITPMQFTVLSLLCQRGEMEQSELAVEAGMDRTNASEVVRRLQSRGQLDVRVHPDHGRRRLLNLTPEGLAMLKRVDPGAQRAHQRIVEGLDSRHRDLFVELMRQAVSRQGMPLTPDKTQ